MPYTIRRATVADLPKMYQVTTDAHRSSAYDILIPLEYRARYDNHYQQAEYHRVKFINKMYDVLRRDTSQIVVADDAGVVKGYAYMQCTDGLYILQSLFVDPVMYGKGMGSALLERALSTVRPGMIVTLYVLKYNLPAIKLYEKYGFTIDGQQNRLFYGAELIKMTLNTVIV